MRLCIGVCEKCNMDCFYCSTQKSFSYSILNNSNIEKIIYCAKEVFGIDEVVYSGGEPLLLDNLPQLVYSIGNEFPEVLQVIETNCSETSVIEQTIKKIKGQVKFRICLSAPDNATLKKIISNGSNYSKIRNNIYLIENSGIEIELHYILVKNVNSNFETIKKYMEEFINSQYIDIYFDEIHCDKINNLSSNEYKVSSDEFAEIMQRLSYKCVKQNEFIIEYRNKSGNRVCFKKNQCNNECDNCLLDNHSLAVTSDGYIRKCSLFNNIQQIHINDMSRDNILRLMCDFKSQYLG